MPDRRVIGERRAKTVALLVTGLAERHRDQLNEDIFALIPRVETITAQDSRIPGDLLPIDDGHVVVQPGEVADRVVDLRPGRPVLGHRQQQHGSWRYPEQDLIQFLEVVVLVEVVVATEVNHRRIEVVVIIVIVGQSSFEHLVAKLDEASGFSIDLDGPAERVEPVAHLSSVPPRGRRENRIPDDDQPVAIDLLGDGVKHYAGLVDRSGHDDGGQHLGVRCLHVRRRNGVGKPADTRNGGHGGARWERIGRRRLTRAARAEQESERDNGPTEHASIESCPGAQVTSRADDDRTSARTRQG